MVMHAGFGNRWRGSIPTPSTRRNLTFLQSFSIIFIEKGTNSNSFNSLIEFWKKLKCLVVQQWWCKWQHTGFMPRRRRSNRTAASKGLCLVDLYTNYLTVVLYTDLLFQLPPTLTLSTQLCGTSSGYEVCGLRRKTTINKMRAKQKRNMAPSSSRTRTRPFRQNSLMKN